MREWITALRATKVHGIRPIRALLLVLMLVLAIEPALAHKKHRSKSRWRVRPDRGLVGLTLVMDASDIRLVVAWNDPPLDESLSDAERSKEVQRRIGAGMAQAIQVSAMGKPCQAHPLRVIKKKRFEIGVRWECEPFGELMVDQTFLEKLSKEHKQVASITGPDGTTDVRAFQRGETVLKRRYIKGQPPTEEEPGPAAAEDLVDEPHHPDPAEERAAPTTRDGGFPVLPVGGGALLVVVVGFALYRRRKSAP